MKIKEKVYVLYKKFKKFYKAYFTEEGTYTSLLPDKIYLKRIYKKRMGKELNLKNPETFTEKLNWLKLYDRHPEYTMMADKYAVREYVKEKIGGEYLVPLVGAWDKIEDIDFDSFPEKFVLKCNHDNGVIICRDKSSFDVENAKKQLEFHLNRDYYKKCREWPYKNIKRKIICEEFLDAGNEKNLAEYKFYCFNGEPQFLHLVNRDGNSKIEHFTFLDMEWKRVPFKRAGKEEHEFLSKKPYGFEKMNDIVKCLAQGCTFVRIDLYNVEGHIFFSEMTFFPAGGFFSVTPEEWNKKIGDMLTLPNKIETRLNN